MPEFNQEAADLLLQVSKMLPQLVDTHESTAQAIARINARLDAIESQLGIGDDEA